MKKKVLTLLFVLIAFTLKAQNTANDRTIHLDSGTVSAPIISLIRMPVKISTGKDAFEAFELSGPYIIRINGPDSIIYQDVGTITIARMNKKTRAYETVAYKQPNEDWVILDSKKAIESLLYVLLMINQ